VQIGLCGIIGEYVTHPTVSRYSIQILGEIFRVAAHSRHYTFNNDALYMYMKMTLYTTRQTLVQQVHMLGSEMMYPVLNKNVQQ